jgi:HAD superfamily hydrolase (TIGR01509 family)
MAAEDHGCADGACRVLPVRSPAPTVDPSAWQVRRRRAVRRAAAARSADRGAPAAVSALVLDVGGVVIPSLFESVELEGFPSGALSGEPEWRRVQRGESTEREYWQAVAAARPGLDIGDLWKRCSRVRDELRGALDAIAARVRVVAFTNDMAHFFGEDWPSRFPELGSFDVIVEAGALGVHKPDPAAFRAAAETIGEPPEACLFVDDLEVNLRGARSAGMHARLFDVRDPAGSIDSVLADLHLDRSDLPGRRRAFRMPVR